VIRRHELSRHEVQQVICSLCGTEQEVGQICISCGVCMGKYFCEVCKLFDDDVSTMSSQIILSNLSRYM
jgi:RING finger/CHY zinc finger protein 1